MVFLAWIKQLGYFPKKTISPPIEMVSHLIAPDCYKWNTCTWVRYITAIHVTHHSNPAKSLPYSVKLVNYICTLSCYVSPACKTDLWFNLHWSHWGSDSVSINSCSLVLSHPVTAVLSLFVIVWIEVYIVNNDNICRSQIDPKSTWSTNKYGFINQRLLSNHKSVYIPALVDRRNTRKFEFLLNVSIKFCL